MEFSSCVSYIKNIWYWRFVPSFFCLYHLLNYMRNILLNQSAECSLTFRCECWYIFFYAFMFVCCVWACTRINAHTYTHTHIHKQNSVECWEESWAEKGSKNQLFVMTFHLERYIWGWALGYEDNKFWYFNGENLTLKQLCWDLSNWMLNERKH